MSRLLGYELQFEGIQIVFRFIWFIE